MDHRLGRILAIDYGERRIGIAISDPLRIIAQGLNTIVSDRRGSHFAPIADIVRENSVSLILVGMPYSLSGRTDNDGMTRVRNFVQELQKFIDIPIEFIDERLSSVEAKRILAGHGYKTGHRKELVDKVAATILLQTYLDSLQGDT